ncbi:MAG: iron-sulfur cluster assembly accessory protein [Vicinamibacteria bacterium]|nr:iron-sulfur cluster assembly accessory protein [Vicinamibacteria bacterium]
MIHLTAAAIDKVKNAIETERERLPSGGLRLFILGNCSGVRPGLALDEAAPRDVVFEQEGVKLIVDPRSLELLQDAVIDYRENALGEGFSIETAHPLPACACGRPCEARVVEDNDRAS